MCSSAASSTRVSGGAPQDPWTTIVYQLRPRTLTTIAALAIIACSVPAFCTSFLNDMDFYSLVANKVLSGRLLYRDAMDTKPPMVFLHYAAIFNLFGPNNVTAIKLVTIALLGLTALFVAMLHRALCPVSGNPALAAVVFVLASFLGFGEDFLSSNTEILANVFIVAGVWMIAARDFACSTYRLLGAGLCIGIACLYRYQSIAPFLAYGTTLLLRRRSFDHKLLRLALVLAGAALPAVVFVAHYARLGALADLRLLLAYQAHYTRDADALSVSTVLARLGMVLAGQWPVELLAAWQIISVTKKAEASRAETFPIAFATWSVAMFFVGKRLFPHYFVQAIPALVLLASPRLVQHRPCGTCRRHQWLMKHALTILAATAVVFAAINGIYYSTRNTPRSHPHLVAFVEANSKSTDEVLLWTWQPELLFETKRTFATRLLVNEMLIGRYVPESPHERRPGMAALWPVFIGDLEASPPKLIFDAPPAHSAWPIDRFPQLAAFLTRYEPCTVLDDVCVYLRRD